MRRVASSPGWSDAERMASSRKASKSKDKTVIHYNDVIAVRDIPLAAYDYVVNGKPAIEWGMERQSIPPGRPPGCCQRLE
jgi:predicted helicase